MEGRPFIGFLWEAGDLEASYGRQANFGCLIRGRSTRGILWEVGKLDVSFREAGQLEASYGRQAIWRY